MTLTRCNLTLIGRDTEQLAKLVEAYTADHGLGNVDEVLDVSVRWPMWAHAKGSAITDHAPLPNTHRITSMHNTGSPSTLPRRLYWPLR